MAEVDHGIALPATAFGLPSTVVVHTWIKGESSGRSLNKRSSDNASPRLQGRRPITVQRRPFAMLPLCIQELFLSQILLTGVQQTFSHRE